MSDWHACGRRIPDDVLYLDCLNCGEQLTISPEGGRRLDEARASGRFTIAGALCTPCTQSIVQARAANGLEVGVAGATATGEEALRRSPHAPGIIEALRRAGAKI